MKKWNHYSIDEKNDFKKNVIKKVKKSWDVNILLKE
jgi:hypothetical protein